MTLIDVICDFCNKKYKIPLKLYNKNIKKNFYCNLKCFGNKLKSSRLGKNNPAYKHGEISSIRKAKKIHGIRCQICNFSGKRISVHHIDGNHWNNPSDGSNWMIVCNSCHSKITALMKKKTSNK